MAADLVEQFSDEEIDGDLRVLANTSACVDLGDARPYLKRVLATIDDRDREIAELRQRERDLREYLRECDAVNARGRGTGHGLTKTSVIRAILDKAPTEAMPRAERYLSASAVAAAEETWGKHKIRPTETKAMEGER